MAAIGADDTPIGTPGGVGNVNAKLRLMTQQLQTLLGTETLTTLLNAATGATTTGAVSMLGVRTFTIYVNTGVSGNTVTFEGSIDGSNWFSVAMRDTVTTASATLTTSQAGGNTTVTKAYVLPADYALAWFRANISTYGSGNVTVKALSEFMG